LRAILFYSAKIFPFPRKFFRGNVRFCGMIEKNISMPPKDFFRPAAAGKWRADPEKIHA